MSALVPYVGKERSGPRPTLHIAKPKIRIAGRPDPLVKQLGPYNQAAALLMFRAGNDTRDIASALNCTESAAANAIARARDAERVR